jgi:prefoldin beta subunit
MSLCTTNSNVVLFQHVVLQELARLDDSATVYKLIGPAMIKQDLMEANTNVAKRLEYIQGEVKRITNKLAELEAKSKEQQQLVSATPT